MKHTSRIVTEEEVKQILKDKMRDLKLNQVQLSKLLGYNPQYLTDVFSGRKKPSTKMLNFINAKKTSVHTVIYEIESEAEENEP